MNTSVTRDTLILWTGNFGQAVAAALASDVGVRSALLTHDQLADPIAHLVPHKPNLVVFVGNRPLRLDLLRVDECLWHSGISWTACELNDMRLLLGPNVLPGVSPCFRCCSARYRGMAFEKTALTEEAAFERHLTLNGEVQVHGFTPAIVHMAVAHIRAFRHDCSGRAGQLREIALPDISIRQGRAIALHGCRLCRPAPAAPADRFTVGLKAAIGIL